MKWPFRSPVPTHVLLPFDTAYPVRWTDANKSDKCTVLIPTDLMFAAWRQVFPAERMAVLGGRRTARGVRVTSVVDVTEPQPSAAHVRADSRRLSTALVDLDRAGAHLAVWMHSHPGEGARATHPSGIDLTQERDLRRHYSDRLISIIVVRDGSLRVWGHAVEERRVVIRWIGRGINKHPGGEPNVYQITLA